MDEPSDVDEDDSLNEFHEENVHAAALVAYD